jgi:hypothetical protein
MGNHVSTRAQVQQCGEFIDMLLTKPFAICSHADTACPLKSDRLTVLIFWDHPHTLATLHACLCGFPRRARGAAMVFIDLQRSGSPVQRA